MVCRRTCTGGVAPVPGARLAVSSRNRRPPPRASSASSLFGDLRRVAWIAVNIECGDPPVAPAMQFRHGASSSGSKSSGPAPPRSPTGKCRSGSGLHCPSAGTLGSVDRINQLEQVGFVLPFGRIVDCNALALLRDEAVDHANLLRRNRSAVKVSAGFRQHRAIKDGLQATTQWCCAGARRPVFQSTMTACAARLPAPEDRIW